MPVQYSCFFSYSGGGWTPEYQKLIDAIELRLRDNIQYYLSLDLWRYSTSESIGANYSAVIPNRLCQSVCMIALYAPVYETKETCIQEYVAMEDIEKQRLKRLNKTPADELPMIIPIILKKRKGNKVPDWISKSLNYLDLPSFIEQIGRAHV